MTRAISHRPSAPAGTRAPRCLRRGFTLVEIAVTASILALAIVTSITTLQRAYTQLDTARNISIASTILQTEMENERLFPWAKLIDATYQPTLGTSFLRDPTIAGRFAITRSIAQVSGRSTQIQVTLTVRWRNYDGRSLSRSYTSYFTQGGLNDFYSGRS